MCSTTAWEHGLTLRLTAGYISRTSKWRKTMSEATAKATRRKSPRGFVDGTATIDRLLSDPERAQRVQKINRAGSEMDRIHALNLAAIRKAAEMTQEAV